MATLLLTHPCFVEHDTGPGHPERPDRMRVLDKVFSDPIFDQLVRDDAPLRDDCEEAILRAHPRSYFEGIKALRPAPGQPSVRLDPDTVLSAGSFEAAMRAVGAGLEAAPGGFGFRHIGAEVRQDRHFGLDPVLAALRLDLAG